MTATSAGLAMRATVAATRQISDYRPVPLVAAEEYAARLMGVEAATVGQWIRGRDRVAERTAAVVLGYIATGHVSRALLFARPITDALAGIRPLDLTLDLLSDAQRDDLTEDGVENEVRLIDPTLALSTPEARATALRLAASKEKAATRDMQAAAAIRAAVARAEAGQ